MSLNHDKGLTNTRRQNKPTASKLFALTVVLSLASGRQAPGICCPCTDAEFMHAVPTTTGQLFYCDILKLLCVLRSQMLPAPL